MQILTKQREISQQSFSSITFWLSTKLVPKSRNSQYEDIKICLKTRGKNQWQFLSKIKSKTKGKKSQQSFKRCNKTKTKMKNKSKWKNKMFFELFNFIKKKSSKRPRKLSNSKPNNFELQEKLQNSPNIIRLL